MATTTSVPWIALGFSLLSTCLAIGVPAYVYFFDKSAAGVMAEDNIKNANGASVVEKQLEMEKKLLNPTDLLGGLKNATTAAATNMANGQISNATGAALKRAEEIGGSSNTKGGLEIGIKSSDDLKNTMGSQKDLLKSSLDNATGSIPGGIPGLTSEVIKRRMQQMDEADRKYYENKKKASTSATKDLKPFDKGNIMNFVPDQTEFTPGYVFNTPPKKRGGGRKTKNNRQKTVQPKIKKPRTKKCLITKGDKMFMSFCI
jgi:hypothetical protein